MLTVINPSYDPFYNAAFEEYIFETFRDDDIFFIWADSPSVVVGSFQNICREVRPKFLLDGSVKVLRRMTGGGTVYHDLGNVNYTYMTRLNGPFDIEKVLEPVISALNRIGIPAEKGGISDILVHGLKISGSAERVSRGRLWHHGTLLFESDLSRIEEITMQPRDAVIDTKGTRSIVKKVANIRDFLTQNPMTLSEFKKAFLSEMLPPETGLLKLSAEDERNIELLRDGKYMSWPWTWGKTPKFRYQKEGVFRGRPFLVSYEASLGILSHVEVVSGVPLLKDLARLLEGSRLDPADIMKICGAAAEDRAMELFELLI